MVTSVKTGAMLLMLGMAGNLYAGAVTPPADNTVSPCDYDPATPKPPCAMDDESLIAPPEMPGGDDGVITPPAPTEEGVREEPPTSIPPPAPIPPKPKPPEEESAGDIPPPQPKPKP